LGGVKELLYKDDYLPCREVHPSGWCVLIVFLLVVLAKIKFFINLLGSRSKEKLKWRKNLVAIFKGLFGGCKGEAMRISYNGENELNRFLMSRNTM
jgi:hypothetical protein